MSDKKEVVEKIVDYTGRECYQMNLALREEIQKIALGNILKLVTDNSEAQEKIHKWCRMNKQQLFLSDIVEGVYVYYIKRMS